jgi:hypothetical protein
LICIYRRFQFATGVAGMMQAGPKRGIDPHRPACSHDELNLERSVEEG